MCFRKSTLVWRSGQLRNGIRDHRFSLVTYRHKLTNMVLHYLRRQLIVDDLTNLLREFVWKASHLSQMVNNQLIPSDYKMAEKYKLVYQYMW